MYNPKTQQIVLEIPKNGSRSLVKAAQTAHGKKCIQQPGHHTAQTLLEWLEQNYPNLGYPVDLVAVLRNPYERFISQLLAYSRNKNVTLVQSLIAARQNQHVIFVSQCDMLRLRPEYSGLVAPRLFTMGNMLQAQRAIGNCRGHMVKINQAPDFNEGEAAKMFSSPVYRNTLETMYARDIALWNAATYGDQEHFSPDLGEL